MTVQSEVYGHGQLRATAAELQSMADLIQKYPAEAQLIMAAYEDGLTLGPMQAMDSDEAPSEDARESQDGKERVIAAMDTRDAAARLIRERRGRIEQGDFSDFAKVTDEEKAAGRLNVEEINSGTLPAVKIAELLGVAHTDGPVAALDGDLCIQVDARFGRIIDEQARFYEVFLHGPIPEPQMPPEEADVATLRAVLEAVVDQVGILGKIGGAYRFGACGSSKDPVRWADFQGQAMAYRMAAIRLADALNRAGALVEVKHQGEQGNEPDPT